MRNITESGKAGRTTTRLRLAAVTDQPSRHPAGPQPTESVNALYAEARRFETSARNMVDERLDGRVPAGEKSAHRERERELYRRSAEAHAKARELEAAESAATAETDQDRFLDEYVAYLQDDDAALVALTTARLNEAMEGLFRAAAALPPEATVPVSSTSGEYATAGALPLSAARQLLRAVHEATGRVQARGDLIALATMSAPVPSVAGPITGRPNLSVVPDGGVA